MCNDACCMNTATLASISLTFSINPSYCAHTTQIYTYVGCTPRPNRRKQNLKPSSPRRKDEQREEKLLPGGVVVRV
eukprot:c3784_g1_i1 orf=2-226(-)